jgi:hypothetical protein
MENASTKADRVRTRMSEFSKMLLVRGGRNYTVSREQLISDERHALKGGDEIGLNELKFEVNTRAAKP